MKAVFKWILIAIGGSIVLVVVGGFLVGFFAGLSGKSPEQVTASLTPQPSHFYDAQDGDRYGYTAEISEDQRKAGQAGSNIIMVSYAGHHGATHQIHIRQAGVLVAFECAQPCDVVKVMTVIDTPGFQLPPEVQHMRASPNMIAAMALRDAMSGQLKQYTELSSEGIPMQVWVDERAGLQRAPLGT